MRSYNMIKKQMQGGDPTYRTSAGQHLLAAAEASTITALMTNPIWVVKTRIFATPKNDPQAYSGLWSEFSAGRSRQVSDCTPFLLSPSFERKQPRSWVIAT